MKTNHYAVISDRIPDTDFPFRVFYYAPGMGFETGNAVYVGRHDCRTIEQAQAAAAKYEACFSTRLPID